MIIVLSNSEKQMEQNITHSKPYNLSGYLKLLPLFLMVVPGMVARALFPDTIGCATEETCMAFCNSKVVENKQIS